VVLQRVADRLVDFAKPFQTTLTNQLLHEASVAAQASALDGAGGDGCLAPLLEDTGPAAVADPAAGAVASGAEVVDGGVTLLEFGGFDVFAMVKRGGLMVPAHSTRGAAVAYDGKAAVIDA
jgi:hypothetical protein